MPTRSTNDPREDRALDDLPDETRTVAKALCEVVRSTVPGPQETIQWNQPVWAGRGSIVGRMLHPRQVHLTGFHGAELTDRIPEIVGTGKAIRHVAVPDVASCRRPVVRTILRTAEALVSSGERRLSQAPFR